MPRKHERVTLSLEAISESSSGKREARVSDLSMGGCYVDSIVTVPVGETVIVSIRMPTGEWMRLSGDVTYCFPGIGFGLRFHELMDHDRSLLERVIRSLGGAPAGYEDPESDTAR
jgi:hypothetical protein